jgi:hypothetical protein
MSPLEVHIDLQIHTNIHVNRGIYLTIKKRLHQTLSEGFQLEKKSQFIDMSNGSSCGSKVKLPMQLVSLIQSHEQGLIDEGYLHSLAPGSAEEEEREGVDINERQQSSKHNIKSATKLSSHHHPPTKVVVASHSKFLKELQSYTRVVCMQLGFA